MSIPKLEKGKKLVGVLNLYWWVSGWGGGEVKKSNKKSV